MIATITPNIFCSRKSIPNPKRAHTHMVAAWHDTHLHIRLGTLPRRLLPLQRARQRVVHPHCQRCRAGSGVGVHAARRVLQQLRQLVAHGGAAGTMQVGPARVCVRVRARVWLARVRLSCVACVLRVCVCLVLPARCVCESACVLCCLRVARV